MTKYKILIFAFLPLCLFGDCPDCEAYKMQVVNDCNSLDFSLQSVANNVNSAVGFANSGYNSSTDANDKAIFATITSTLANTQGYIDSVSSFVSSIRATAQSLQCNASSNTVGSCDCAQYLQTLIELLQTCNQTVASVKSGMESVVSSLGSISPGDDDIVSTLNTIRRSFEDFSFIVNAFIANDYGDLEYNISDFYRLFSSITNGLFGSANSLSISASRLARPTFSYRNGKVTLSSETVSSQFSSPAINSLSFISLLRLLSQQSLLYYNSQLSYDYTNLVAVSSIARGVESLSSITNFLNEKFTIFTPSSPLEIYTQGSEQNYYQFLTNYYIKVSTGGTLSPSEPHTNWFSRIEMLLASLVFQDDGTNFVDDAENTSQIENTLSQSVDTLSQAVSLPQNVTGKIDNMGQSFLGLLGEWRTIVSGNSLPSQFVLCDINLGSQSRDSSGGSSVSSFRLETSLDSGEFRQFLDFCHAVTTILFTMLFVWLSMLLLSFLLGSLAKLAHLCFVVYSALFGG